MHFRRANAPPGTSMTVLEVAAPAHSLQHYLNHTQPKARGRTRPLTGDQRDGRTPI